jgi:hypothetical protein
MRIFPLEGEEGIPMIKVALLLPVTTVVLNVTHL